MCAENQQFAALLWSLWKHRNLRLWQGVTGTVAQVMDRARHLIEDWLIANIPTHATHSSSSAMHSTTANHQFGCKSLGAVATSGYVSYFLAASSPR